MTTFHQMGHDSENLLYESELNSYRGVILSPVNRTLDEIKQHVTSIRKNLPHLEIIFDPQLYFPHSQRENLKSWDYFPNELDTHDITDLAWWDTIIANVVSTCNQFQPNRICSPVIVPRGAFTSDYYELTIQTGDTLHEKLTETDTLPVQTVIVRISDLSNTPHVYELASQITQARSRELMLLFISDVTPRRELVPGDDLRGGMILIKLLSDAGFRVTVAMSSTEMILWKVAGAADCATGKFFNLRRFTPGRWDDPNGGGGQVAYWFEESLLAFVRETDLLRIKNQNLLSESSLSNPYGARILERFTSEEKRTPWVGDSWRHYLWWFADAEARISAGEDVEAILKNAETGWLLLDEKRILMEEMRNDGAWVRQWRRALIEYQKEFSL